MTSSRAARGAVAAALAAMFLLFARPLLSPAARINLHADNEWMLGATLAFSSQALRNGDWPLRIDTVLGGLPLYDSPQVSPWYPLYLLPFDLYATPLATVATLHRVTLLHAFLFSVNAYVLLRALRMGRLAALFGTLFIVYNGTTLGVMKWAHLIASYCWLPLYLAGVVRVLECRSGFRGTGLACGGLALVASAMVGQPLVIAAVLTVVLVASWAASRCMAGETGAAVAGSARLAPVLAAASCLTAPFVLPVVAGLPSMIRWVGPTTAIVANEPMPFECFTADQFAVDELPAFVLPWATARHHSIAQPYIGLFPLLLAACCPWRRPARHWAAIPLAAVAAYSLLSCFGDAFGLVQLNCRIPLVNKIREASYFLLPLNLAVGILAGWGVDRLLAMVRRPGGGSVGAGRLVLVTILLTAAVVAQKSGVAWRCPTVRNSDYLRSQAVLLESVLARIRQLDPDREYRVVFGRDIDSQMAAMLASYHGVRTLTCYLNPLPLAQFNEIYYHGPRGDTYPQVLGARYLVCRESDAEPVAGYETRERLLGFEIREDATALPHTFVTNNVVGSAPDHAAAVAALSAHDLETLPLVRNAADERPDDAARNRPAVEATWKPEVERLNHKSYAVACDRPAMFVLNEYHSPEWRAWVDGVEVRTQEVNASQIGVPLPAGGHVVEFRYQPGIVRTGVLLALIGGLLAAALLAAGRGPAATS